MAWHVVRRKNSFSTAAAAAWHDVHRKNRCSANPRIWCIASWALWCVPPLSKRMIRIRRFQKQAGRGAGAAAAVKCKQQHQLASSEGSDAERESDWRLCQ